MIINVQPDKQKSMALKKMAEITLERLKETDIEKYPGNALSDYYDIIHKLMEALTAREGKKFKGEGAHKEVIEYIVKKWRLDEQTRQFLQQMREYRNNIAYEGFMINKNYIVLNEKKIKEIIKKLVNILNNK